MATLKDLEKAAFRNSIKSGFVFRVHLPEEHFDRYVVGFEFANGTEDILRAGNGNARHFTAPGAINKIMRRFNCHSYRFYEGKAECAEYQLKYVSNDDYRLIEESARMPAVC